MESNSKTDTWLESRVRVPREKISSGTTAAAERWEIENVTLVRYKKFKMSTQFVKIGIAPLRT